MPSGHEIIAFQFAVNKEKPTMKRLIYVLATAVLLLNTFAFSAAKSDGGVGGTSCGSNGSYCKP